MVFIKSSPKRPLIIVQAGQQEVEKGQPLIISARLFHPATLDPFPVARIFMNIVSKKDGHVVWPLEVVRKNTHKFDIQIGTDMMKDGHEYFIRVSNNWNMSPNGSTTFKVKKNIAVIPIALFPLLVPERQPEDDLVRRTVEKFLFRTQMDHRVCPICQEFEDQEFSPNKPKPVIPLHFNCRCTYDVIFKEIAQLNAQLDEMAAVVDVARKARHESDMFKVMRAVKVIDGITNS